MFYTLLTARIVGFKFFAHLEAWVFSFSDL